MPSRVAINGFGRIGRSFVRSAYDNEWGYATRPVELAERFLVPIHEPPFSAQCAAVVS